MQEKTGLQKPQNGSRKMQKHPPVLQVRQVQRPSNHASGRVLQDKDQN